MPPFRCVSLRQRNVAVEVVGPVTAAPASAFGAERSPQSRHDPETPAFRIVGDFCWSDRQYSRQMPRAIVGLGSAAHDRPKCLPRRAAVMLEIR